MHSCSQTTPRCAQKINNRHLAAVYQEFLFNCKERLISHISPCNRANLQRPLPVQGRSLAQDARAFHYDAVRGLRMGTFGLLFYGPYQHYWYSALERQFPHKTAQNFLAKVGGLSEYHQIARSALAGFPCAQWNGKRQPWRIVPCFMLGDSLSRWTLLLQPCDALWLLNPSCLRPSLPAFADFCPPSPLPLQVTLNQLALAPVVLCGVFAWNLALQGQASQVGAKIRRDLPTSLVAGWKFWVPAASINFWIVPLQRQVGVRATRLRFGALSGVFWGGGLASGLVCDGMEVLDTRGGDEAS